LIDRPLDWLMDRPLDWLFDRHDREIHATDMKDINAQQSNTRNTT
jgi:hypothetical protein